MTTPLTLTDADKPDYLSPAYKAMQPGWEFIRLIRDINTSIRKESAKILPKAAAEGKVDYDTRVQLTVGFDALDETIHAVVGLATRHDPVLEEDVPAPLVTDWEDVDLAGTHGSIFAQQVLEHAVTDGHCGVLTDYPPAPPGLTLAQEQAMGLRPYLVLVPIERITAWLVGRVLGRHCLLMVKLEEGQERPLGEFGSVIVRRFRTLRQEVRPDGTTPYVTFTVDEETKSGTVVTWSRVASGELRGPEWIPLRIAYGGEQLGILLSKPPLRGLAWSNLEHVQVTSDHRWSLYKCGLALPVAIGRADTASPLVLSSDVVTDVAIGGDLKFAQGAGTALQPAADTLTQIERRMGSQGFSMMRREAQTQQTLGEKEMQAAREESKLARAVRSVHDCLEGALQDMAAFLKLDSGGSITMDRNFSDVFLTAEEMRILLDLEAAGNLTTKTMLLQLQAGGRILQGVDVEEEEQALKLEQAQEPLTAPDNLPAGATMMPDGSMQAKAA